MSGHQIKRFVCCFLCFFFAAPAAAFAESMPGPAAGLQTETPAIEDDFWLSGNYTLSVWPENESGELRVEIFLEDHQTGDQVLWVFPCDSGSKPDNLLSHTCTETDNTYDEDNLLVQNVYPDQACEARFILDEKDQVTISGKQTDLKTVISSSWKMDRNGGWRTRLLKAGTGSGRSGWRAETGSGFIECPAMCTPSSSPIRIRVSYAT